MTITHSRGEYQIHFVRRHEVPKHLPLGAPVLTDRNVRKVVSDWMFDHPTRAMPAGEESKNLRQFGESLEWLAKEATPRTGVLIALGGGVVGDLAGYVAASYMRGIPYVQVPTTLLSQVDSSVGGKVGIDLKHGKNLAGAFHPPSSVVICTDVLASLDVRQFNNGMAEVWKYGFIRDLELVDELMEFRLTANHPQIEAVVRRCIRHKRDVVEQDEFETKGLRATLNYGHTIGHAIEQVTQYTEFLHGEAISIGMVAEAKLGEELGVSKKGTSERVRECLAAQGLPVVWELKRNARELLEAMKRDKKATKGKLAFSLLEKIGECKLVEDVSSEEVASILETL